MRAIRTTTVVVAAILAVGVARAAEQPKPATQATGPGPASVRAAQSFQAEIVLGEITLQGVGPSMIPVVRVRVVDTTGKDVTTHTVVRLTLCGGWHELAVVPQAVKIPTFPCKVEASIDQVGPAPLKARPVSRTYTAPTNERGSSVSPK
jgi:hypothetical protein